MTASQDTRVIYGDAPFIEDMRLLTTLCLLNDKVILIGNAALHEQLQQTAPRNEIAGSVISQTVESLIPEGVVWFVSPTDLDIHFPGAGNIELSGLQGIEPIETDGRVVVSLRLKHSELNDTTRVLLRGFGSNGRTVSDFLRELSLVAASMQAGLPVVYQQRRVSLAASSSRVPEVAAFLAQRTFERLVLPDLQAYHAEDILEARLKLKSELLEFRAGVRELVWLLHQQVDLSGDLRGLATECDILIDTKIAAAVSNLERSIAAHESKKIRRILKTMSGALLEVGKSLVSPTFAGILFGGSGAILKVVDGLEASAPAVQIASFIYKVREKQF